MDLAIDPPSFGVQLEATGAIRETEAPRLRPRQHGDAPPPPAAPHDVVAMPAVIGSSPQAVTNGVQHNRRAVGARSPPRLVGSAVTDIHRHYAGGPSMMSHSHVSLQISEHTVGATKILSSTGAERSPVYLNPACPCGRRWRRRLGSI